MKILCLTPWFPRERNDPHGSYILDSVEALADLGHEITVLITEPYRLQWRKKNKGSFISEKIKIHSCKHFSIPRNYCRFISNYAYRKKVAPILKALIQQYDCDLIHAHTELPGIAAIDVSRQCPIPCIITIHGINTDKKLYTGKTRQLFFHYTYENAARLVLVGKPLIPFAKQFVSDDSHFRIIHNGFRFSEQHNHADPQKWPEKLRFISVSNLEEGKGIELNLQAFAKLKQENIVNWTYQIVGDGSLRHLLESLVDQYHLRDHVIFLGALTHDQVYVKLAEADIFTLPSYREAFGIAYIEAMSMGLLTIGIQDQGPDAFISHEKTGFLLPPHNRQALANTFKKIFLSREKMQEIALNGKNHIRNYFTWRRHAENLIDVYREAVRETLSI